MLPQLKRKEAVAPSPEPGGESWARKSGKAKANLSIELSLNLTGISQPSAKEIQTARVPGTLKKTQGHQEQGIQTARVAREHSSQHILSSSRGKEALEELVFPATAAQVLQRCVENLTDYEKSEILDYHDVYYVGDIQYKGRKATNANHGYDDEKGDYRTMIHDQLGYRFEAMQTLGRGSFGQVLKCYDHKNKNFVALKIIRNKTRFHQQAMVEIQILEHIRDHDLEHKAHAIHIIKHFRFRNHLCITFELMGVNLYEYIKQKNFEGVDLKTLRSFAQQMLQCLNFLTHHNIIHCDLKPENILIRNSRQSQIAVIDFGSSCFEDKRLYTYIQSRFYRSPEVILGLAYGKPIDMWSFGCILAELYTGRPLFPGENEAEQLGCIMELLGIPPEYLLQQSTRQKLFFDAGGEPRPITNSRGYTRVPGSKSLEEALACPDLSFVQFLRASLAWDPARRLKPEEALQHPWIMYGPCTRAPNASSPPSVNAARRRPSLDRISATNKESAGARNQEIRQPIATKPIGTRSRYSSTRTARAGIKPRALVPTKRIHNHHRQYHDSEISVKTSIHVRGATKGNTLPQIGVGAKEINHRTMRNSKITKTIARKRLPALHG